MPFADWLPAICRLASMHRLHVTETVIKKQLKEPHIRPRNRDIFAVCSRDYGVVEDCHDDSRGPQGLMWGVVRARVIHVRCSYERAMPPQHQVISCYWPDTRPWLWTPDFKQRL